MAKEHTRQRTRIFSILISSCLAILVLSLGLFAALENAGKAGHTSVPSSGTTSANMATSTLQTPVQPLFFDNFADTSKGWYLGDFGGYTRTIHNNMLTLADSNHQVLTESLPTTTSFDDFALTVTFTLLEATPDDSVGIYLRGDSYLDHDYRLDFFDNNTYAVSKEFLDKDKVPAATFLLRPTATPFLHPSGQRNTITVMMKAAKLVLMINNEVVNSVIDMDYRSGQIALFVKNAATSNRVRASFSNIVIYPAPETLPKVLS
ncbi:MAG: DUF1080 domain-containing protein [Chloroflexota bacterium]|nr:DUF1080 domain-containing protein [Chloroflexota bacterium]